MWNVPWGVQFKHVVVSTAPSAFYVVRRRACPLCASSCLQLRCLTEIENDMVWRKIPMDRLLCGDVGFGKTEVALRAMFRWGASLGTGDIQLRVLGVSLNERTNILRSTHPVFSR